MIALVNVKVTLEIRDMWPEGVTIEKAAKELGMNPRSITNIRKGTERGSWDTLVKLSRWLSWHTGKTVLLDDLLVIEDDDYHPEEELSD